MKYCAHCGKQLVDEAVVCIGCGCSVEPPKTNEDPNDKSSFGFALLGFLIPIVGLILYLVYKDTLPKRAKSCGKGALIGFIIGVVITVLNIVLLPILFSYIGTFGSYSYNFRI